MNRLSSSIENLKLAFAALERLLKTPVTEPRDLSGIVKDFEIVYELSWKTLKKFLESEGHSPRSAREAFLLAFQLGYLEDDRVWVEMIEDRNLTGHTYNQPFAASLVKRIREKYLPALAGLRNTIVSERENPTNR